MTVGQRFLDVSLVREAVAKLVMDANCCIGEDMMRCLERCRDGEEKPLSRSILDKIVLNDRLAEERMVAMCQDTGMAIFRVQVGQEIRFTGGSLDAAIQAVPGCIGHLPGRFSRSHQDHPSRKAHFFQGPDHRRIRQHRPNGFFNDPIRLPAKSLIHNLTSLPHSRLCVFFCAFNIPHNRRKDNLSIKVFLTISPSARTF